MSTGPASAPPAAPAAFIPKSDTPWTAGRSGTSTASETSADAETTDADHPSPSRTRLTVTAAPESAAVPATIKAASSSPCPNRITRWRPARSESQPKTGDNAYIPAMCRLMVNPTRLIDAPWLLRCTGVIDISATITAWLRAMTATAYRACALVRRILNPDRFEAGDASPAPAARRRFSSSSGSGRSPVR
ncbi:hypothetical protein AO716_13465 [Arthrobacter sp. Edens01]|nr:hypothetical protein AO716_13465 [Arthrobacter sp. Edens01]